MASLRTLRQNLIVLAAVKDPEQLVAFCGRLFEKGSWLGRIILWIRHFQKSPQSSDVLIEQCKADLHQLFVRMDKVYKRHVHHEIQRLEKKPYSVSKRDRAESEILRACTYLRPLFKEIGKNSDSYLNQTMAPQDGSWVPIAKSVRFIDQKHAYEHLSKQPLPLELFDLCVQGIPLKVQQERALLAWIKSVRRVKNVSLRGFNGPYENHYITSRKLHRLFLDLNDRLLIHCQSNRDDKVKALQNLEMKLCGCGLRELAEEDPKHRMWVDAIKPGDRFPYMSGDDFILEQEVTREEEKALKRRVFSIQGSQDREWLAYQNKSAPYLECTVEWKVHFGIPLPAITAIDEALGTAFREKIVDRVSDYRWKSGASILKADAPQLKVLGELLSLFSQLSYTPYPLHPDMFGFTADGEMRALMPMEESSFSFEALEKFAYEISQGNLLIFNQLMKLGGLLELNEAKEYQIYSGKVFDGLLDQKFPTLPVKHPELQARYQTLQNRIRESFEMRAQGILSKSKRKKIVSDLLQKYKQASFRSFLPNDYL